MKKATVSVPYDEEKLSAIKLFLSKKSLDLTKELTVCMDGLFKKYVPPEVRSYLELKDGNPSPTPAKRPAAGTAAAQDKQ